ncbi:GNAT family N-acetyltransferase [Psychromonas aquimarina]|uniref:GNAT family N-acetyltransferase n=1 Tax=Psychromonas aquimarina TaxID=444919 RepID=UPI000685CCF9|nr:GNAT family N-acetyltransferase [Psychromonas aquimarina]
MTDESKLNKAMGCIALIQRPVTAQDNDILRELYCACRDDEAANSGMPAEMVKTFLEQQFALQQKHYYQVYDPAGFKVLEYQGRVIGRLYSESKGKDIRLIDISLFREYRNLGIGTFLIKQLQERAMHNQSTLSLHVHSCSPALKLYLTLGFNKIEMKNEYLYMQYGN